MTSFPATLQTGFVQHFSGAPSINTMQQPHCSSPQPKRVPIRPSSLRNTLSSGVSSLSSDTLTDFPLTEKLNSLGTHTPRSQIAHAKCARRDCAPDQTAY